ncbi:MAG: hypothetical protein IKF66_01255 [Methanobrevibacter sp.]|nr:hypothetical protein [Methanobrevibacter sp.]
MKGFCVFLFALIMTVLFWAVSLEIKTDNLEQKNKQILEYVEKLENKVDQDFDVLINKRWE